jgi:hypothetical protein
VGDACRQAPPTKPYVQLAFMCFEFGYHMKGTAWPHPALDCWLLRKF